MHIPGAAAQLHLNTISQEIRPMLELFGSSSLDALEEMSLSPAVSSFGSASAVLALAGDDDFDDEALDDEELDDEDDVDFDDDLDEDDDEDDDDEDDDLDDDEDEDDDDLDDLDDLDEDEDLDEDLDASDDDYE